ncbi:MAG: hypothetical protein M3R37_01980 [Actinomycetota bacterium]|nr:hypothetical protein [Actinomycetota bacterium]
MRDFLRSPLARLWVPVLAPAAGLAYLDRGTDSGDLVYFVHRGQQLVSSGWADTFADPRLQSGPLQLALFGAVQNLAALAFLIEVASLRCSSTCSAGSAFPIGPALPSGCWQWPEG